MPGSDSSRHSSRGRPRGDARNRFDERRTELAAAAMEALSELGYARTSLREIAQHSQYSHGVLHYYFADKNDLISACVQLYRAESIKRNTGVVKRSLTADQLRAAFAELMAQTLVEHGSMHRLWYDLRWQSVYETSFRGDVQQLDTSLRRMLWHIVVRYAELAGLEPSITPAHAYAVFDGMFYHALLRSQTGDDGAAPELREQVERTLTELIG